MLSFHRCSRLPTLWGLGLLTLGFAGCAPAGPPVEVIEPVPLPAAPGAMAPHLATIAGRPAMTWLEPVTTGAAKGPPWRLRFAHEGVDGTWSTPVTVAAEGEEFFANWADMPSVVEAPGGDLVAHWLAKVGGGTYAYGVRWARSRDGGLTWVTQGTLHADTSETEHGFATLVAQGNFLRAFWLDGRDTAAGGAMGLRTARITAAGVEGEELLDDRVCDCCATAALNTPQGPMIAYRDRTEDEIRDVSLLRGRPDGTWEARAPVVADGWKIPGCPVNGPALANHGNTVWLAWFSMPGERARVAAAVSRDGGATFGPVVVVDAAAPLGRVGLAALPDGSAVLSWLASRGEREAAVMVVRLDAAGRLGAPLELARTPAARASGVPRVLAGPDDTLRVVWVAPAANEGGTSALRLVRFAASRLAP